MPSQHLPGHQERRRLDEKHRRPRAQRAAGPDAIARNQTGFRRADCGVSAKLPAPLDVAIAAGHDQRPVWLDRPHRKPALAPDWNFVSNRETLPLGQNAIGAGTIEISEKAIEPVVAVETAALVAHLHQPGPDVRRRGVDGDAECRFVARQRHLIIAKHGAVKFCFGGSPRSAPSTQSVHADPGTHSPYRRQSPENGRKSRRNSPSPAGDCGRSPTPREISSPRDRNGSGIRLPWFAKRIREPFSQRGTGCARDPVRSTS